MRITVEKELIERELLAGKGVAYILGELEATDTETIEPWQKVLFKKTQLDYGAFKAGYDSRKAIINEVKKYLEKGKRE